MISGKSKRRLAKAELRFIRKLIGPPEPAPPEFENMFENMPASDLVISMDEFQRKYPKQPE